MKTDFHKHITNVFELNSQNIIQLIFNENKWKLCEELNKHFLGKGIRVKRLKTL